VPVPNDSPRRVKASPKYSGVYYRIGADGKKDYELDLRTVGGGWETVGPVGLMEAVALRSDRISRAKLKGEHLGTGPGPTFGDVRREWEAARRIRPGTAAGYDSNLNLYAQQFEKKRIRSIDRAQLVLWLGKLRSQSGKPLAEGTKSLILSAVSSVMEYAVSVGYRTTNPVHEIKGDQRPRQGEGRRRILSRDEEAELLAVCEKRFPWLGDLVVVATYQALRWESVNLSGGKLRIYEQLVGRKCELGPTKSAKVKGGLVVRRDPRDIHPIDLMPPAHAVLQRLSNGVGLSGFVFHTKDGKPKVHRDIGRAFDKAVEYAKLPVTEDGRVTFHSLRHTGISRLANHPQVPLVYVRDFAGHTDLRTTETYVHKIDSATVTAAAAEAMGGLATELPKTAAGLRRVK
jgi:integrase